MAGVYTYLNRGPSCWHRHPCPPRNAALLLIVFVFVFVIFLIVFVVLPQELALDGCIFRLVLFIVWVEFEDVQGNLGLQVIFQANLDERQG